MKPVQPDPSTPSERELIAETEILDVVGHVSPLDLTSYSLFHQLAENDRLLLL